MNLALTSGTMLFNPEEADILLHRPIEPRVLLSAKVTTIALFSLALGVTLSLGGMAIGMAWTKAGWWFLPAHLLSLTLEIVFCAGFIVLTYNLCLRWFGRERLENMMTGVQVLVAVGIMVAGQLLPRLLMRMDLTHARLPGMAGRFSARLVCLARSAADGWRASKRSGAAGGAGSVRHGGGRLVRRGETRRHLRAGTGSTQ